MTYRPIFHVHITNSVGDLLADVDAVSTADGLAYYLHSRNIDRTATEAMIKQLAGTNEDTAPVFRIERTWDGRIANEYLATVAP